MVRGLVEASGNEHEVVAFAPAGPRSRQRIAAALDGFPVEQRLPLVLPLRTLGGRRGADSDDPRSSASSARSTSFTSPTGCTPLSAPGCRTTTFYDLIPLRFPDWVHPRTLRMHTRKAHHAARTCELVFAISAFTANDLTELLGIPPDRIVVAHPGVDAHFRPEGPRAERDQPYVFAVLDWQPRKNLEQARARPSSSSRRVGPSSSWLSQAREPRRRSRPVW